MRGARTYAVAKPRRTQIKTQGDRPHTWEYELHDGLYPGECAAALLQRQCRLQLGQWVACDS